MNSSVLKKAIEHLKHYGLHDFIYKVLETIHDKKNNKYCWDEVAPSDAELEFQKGVKFEYSPVVSILVPTYETKPMFLIQLLDSIIAQTYSEWELCLADASSTDAVEKVVVRYKRALSEEQSSRIKYMKLMENGGISENTNRAYEMATGEFVGLLDHDDVLAPNALYEMVSAINSVEPEMRTKAMLYSDEDKIDENGENHFYPHFKLDFNLEYLRTNNYICHFLVVSNELARNVGGWRKEFDGAQDYDFILRCSEQAKSIIHVPKILYHWRVSNTSTAGDKYTKLYAYEAGKKAIEEHLKRCGESGNVSILKELGTYRVDYGEICVWQDNGYKKILLSEVVNKISDYICFVERTKLNRAELQECKKPFVYIYTDMNRPDLERLLSFFSRKEVVAVAPKTVRGNKILQNGLLFDESENVIYLFSNMNKNFKGYFKRAALPFEAEGISIDNALFRREVLIESIHEGQNVCDKGISVLLKKLGFILIQDSDCELRR